MSSKFVPVRRSTFARMGSHGSVVTALVLAASLAAAGCSEKKEGAAPPADSSAHSHGSDTGAHSHGPATGPSGTQTQTTKLEFLSEPAVIKPGVPSTWTLKILDAKSGAPVSDFDVVHEKLMHLLLISSDLSWFNHIHPEYKGNGVFTISAVLPTSGSYKLYADYTPKGAKQEVAQYELATDGNAPAPTSVILVADSVGKGGWMERRVTSAPEGEPDKTGGAAYTVALMPMPTKLVPGKDAMLHFQVRDAAGKPISDLKPYLGAMGHLVVLSSDTKTFLHAHPMDGGMESMAGMDHSKMDHGTTGATPHADTGATPHDHAVPASGGPDVIFHTNFPSAGLYKVWGQFLHNGKIITAPFTIQVG